jgi:hypothetical protein
MSCTCKQEKSVITVRGDMTSTQFVAGLSYRASYRLSPPVLRSQGPTGGLVPLTTGRLQLRRFSFNYSNTGAFEVTVTPKFRSQNYTTKFNARHVGVGDNKLTTIRLDTGSLRVSSPGRAEDLTIEIVNNSFLPSWITGVEWEGVYETSSRRV